jgi:hypothetical protein
MAKKPAEQAEAASEALTKGGEAAEKIMKGTFGGVVGHISCSAWRPAARAIPPRVLTAPTEALSASVSGEWRNGKRLESGSSDSSGIC